MKKLNLILLLIILITSFVSATSYTSDTPVIKAYLESISPYPVEPGQDFTIQMRIYNEGGRLAEGINADITYGKDFFLKSKDNDFDKPFNLCVGCSKDNTYYFVVSPDTLSGEYPISLKVYRDGAITEKKVFVRVIGQPDIIFNTKLTDNDISSDSEFDVMLNINNVGTGIARNIKLEPTTDGFVMKESNLVFIKELKPNEEINKTIHIMTANSLSQNPHKLNFKLTYKNEKSNPTILNQVLGVKLLNIVKLDLASVTIEPQSIIKGKEVIVIVRVENLGEGKAENIQVQLKNIDFKGQTKAYIGKLDEGEDAPAVFTLIPSDMGMQKLEIVITYEDDKGEHELIDTLDLSISLNYKLWGGIILTICILILFFIAATGFLGYEFWKSGEYGNLRKKVFGFCKSKKCCDLKKKVSEFWEKRKREKS